MATKKPLTSAEKVQRVRDASLALTNLVRAIAPPSNRVDNALFYVELATMILVRELFKQSQDPTP